MVRMILHNKEIVSSIFISNIFFPNLMIRGENRNTKKNYVNQIQCLSKKLVYYLIWERKAKLLIWDKKVNYKYGLSTA